jgi:class 3 adenylate cyclase
VVKSLSGRRAGGNVSAERVERRLAAILAADVAGYSRLMGEDETGTLARLKALRRELIDPELAEHKGRVVKTTGDGLLIEFPSVVEAVACALAVQHGMAERNASIPSARRVEFRVGINLGDVIIRWRGHPRRRRQYRRSPRSAGRAGRDLRFRHGPRSARRGRLWRGCARLPRS